MSNWNGLNRRVRQQPGRAILEARREVQHGHEGTAAVGEAISVGDVVVHAQAYRLRVCGRRQHDRADRHKKGPQQP